MEQNKAERYDDGYEDYYVEDEGWFAKLKRKVKGKYYQASLYEDAAGTYDYGFLTTKEQIDKRNPLDDFKKTGVWHGYEYYKRSTIDYKYVEQMANALSAAYNITIVQAKDWAIDLEKMRLYYNPTTLMYGTKADVMAALLHEIGHLRFTMLDSDMKHTGLTAKYPTGAHEVINLFEDMRIDTLMKISYPGAEGIYESNKETVKKISGEYLNRAWSEKRSRNDTTDKTLKRAFGIDIDTEGKLEQFCKTNYINYEHMKKIDATSRQTIINALIEYKANTASSITLMDYCAGIVLVAYGHKLGKEFNVEVIELVEKTRHAIPMVESAKTTQEVEDILNVEVLPVIEHLLEIKEKDEEMWLGDMLNYLNGGHVEGKGMESRMKTRGHGASPYIPQEWAYGDYGSLRESVNSSILELTRLLKNIKTEDLKTEWENNLKRGKVNVKSLYRVPSGRYDVFKKKVIHQDRVKTFAFSLWVDTSGSMSGERMIQATRGLIILAETFSRMGIPFEILSFENTATFQKTFNEEYKGNTLTKVGYLATRDGGGNMANMGLEKFTLLNRPEENKFVVALSDGVMDNMPACRSAFKKYHDLGIKYIGVDISGEEAMSTLGMDKVFQVDEPNAIPAAFVEAFKGIVKTIKRKA